VTLAELRGELEKSYRSTVYCSSQIVQEEGRVRSHYCGQRWCLVCGRIRTGRAINAYGPVLSAWDAPYLVTLTRRNVAGGDLASSLDGMQGAFRRCTDAMRQRAKRGAGVPLRALRKLECTHNPARGDFHPHFHALVDGGEAAHALRALWLDQHPTTATAAGQDVRPCQSETSLLEVFKYFTKLTTKSRQGRAFAPAGALDVVFRAMRRRRVWQPVGFKLPADVDAEIEGEELELAGSPAFVRAAEDVLWEWEQDVADWADHTTGELLSGYAPSEALHRLAESAGR
jgi:hypothetical protein